MAGGADEDPEWLKKASRAYDVVKTRRFFATAHDVGSRSEFRTFGYLVENVDAEKDQRVVPLYELRRKVQHGMEVRDNDGKELVYVQSGVGAKIAARHFQDAVADQNRKLESTSFQIASITIDADTINNVFSPPIVTPEDRLAHLTACLDANNELYRAMTVAIVKAIQLRKGAGWKPRDPVGRELAQIPELEQAFWLAALHSGDFSFNVLCETMRTGLGDDATSVRVREFVAAAVRIRYLIRFVSIHREDFIPLAILNKPIPKATGEDPPFTFVTHTVRGWGLRGEESFLRNAGRLAANTLTCCYWDRVEFPVNPEATSTHFRVNLANGLRFFAKTPPTPANKKLREAFARHAMGGRGAEEHPWDALEDTSFTFYREVGALNEYRELEGRAEHAHPDPPPTDGHADDDETSDSTDPPSFEIKVRARERSTTVILSILLLLASAVSAWLVSIGNQLGTPMATATIAISIALAVFCAERAAIRRAIIWRIAICVGAVIVAVALRVILAPPSAPSSLHGIVVEILP